MQSDIERFLQVLEAERGFSVNTILAYRNDLTQFLGYLRGEEPGPEWRGDSGPAEDAPPRDRPGRRGRYKAGTSSPTSNSQAIYSIKGPKVASSTVARKMAAIKSFFGF